MGAAQILHHLTSQPQSHPANTTTMSVENVTLASGHKMPLVGFGLWKVPADKAADIVYNAIKQGYRLFDGAYDYQNEKEAGQGIKRAIDEGLVKREDIFVTTKLWNNYHKREHALQMAKAQNEAWGLGYIDLYLIHFPIALPYIVQPSLIDLAQENKIVVTAYSSFGPQSFLELPPAFRARPQQVPLLFEVEPVKKAAQRTGKTPAQVLLRWSTQRHIAVIPKSNNVDRLQQNLEVTNFDLTDEEIKAISALDKGLRFNDPGFYLHKPLRIFA